MSRSSYVERENCSEYVHHEVDGEEEFSPSPYVVTPTQLREGDYDTLTDVEERVEGRAD